MPSRRGRRSGRSARWGRRLAWREALQESALRARMAASSVRLIFNRVGRARDLVDAFPDTSIDAAWLPGPLEVG